MTSSRLGSHLGDRRKNSLPSSFSWLAEFSFLWLCGYSNYLTVCREGSPSAPKSCFLDMCPLPTIFRDSYKGIFLIFLMIQNSSFLCLWHLDPDLRIHIMRFDPPRKSSFLKIDYAIKYDSIIWVKSITYSQTQRLYRVCRPGEWRC